jgi:hypothetical protein
MAWSSTGTRFTVAKNSNTGVAAHYVIGGWVCKIYATTTTTIEEIRGLTQSAALNLVASNTLCNKDKFETKQGSMWAYVPMLVGTEKHAEARRANEANGWTVTITTSETSASASWKPVTNA